MAKTKRNSFADQLEKTSAAARDAKDLPRLHATGTTAKYPRAIEDLKKLCDPQLESEFEVELIDIFERPIFPKGGKIIAAPTVVKELPAPVRKFIGDLSNTERILAGLDLRSEK